MVYKTRRQPSSLTIAPPFFKPTDSKENPEPIHGLATTRCRYLISVESTPPRLSEVSGPAAHQTPGGMISVLDFYQIKDTTYLSISRRRRKGIGTIACCK
jgi:hypothetical protein